MNSIRMVFFIFFSPQEVFNNLKNKSNWRLWILPLTFAILISIICTYILLPSIIIPEQIARVENNPYLDAEQKEARINYFTYPFYYFTTLFEGVVNIFLFSILISFILMYFGWKLSGKSCDFKNIFSAVIYINLIASLGTIFNSVIRYEQGTMATGFNLAYFFPNITGFYHHLLRTITIFGFWQAILYSLLLAVYYQISKKKAFFSLFNLYFIWVFFISFIMHIR